MDQPPRLGRLLRSRWGLYGTAGKRSVTCEASTEEDAFVRLMQQALKGDELSVIVFRTDTYELEVPTGEMYYGKRRKDVHTVILRLGSGCGWWEDPQRFAGEGKGKAD